MRESGIITVYLKSDELKKVNFLCEVTKKNRSSLFRDMINSAYDEIQSMDNLFVDDAKKKINKEFNVLDLLNNLSKEIKSLKRQSLKLQKKYS